MHHAGVRTGVRRPCCAGGCRSGCGPVRVARRGPGEGFRDPLDAAVSSTSEGRDMSRYEVRGELGGSRDPWCTRCGSKMPLKYAAIGKQTLVSLLARFALWMVSGSRVDLVLQNRKGPSNETKSLMISCCGLRLIVGNPTRCRLCACPVSRTHVAHSCCRIRSPTSMSKAQFADKVETCLCICM